MKIQYLSDLHIEFHRDGGKSLLKSIKPVGDVLLCAGDYTVFANYTDDELVEAFQMLLDIGPPVLYVPGNHELYKGSFKSAARALQMLQDRLPSLGVLEAGKVVERGSQRFLGGTMWFPWAGRKLAEAGEHCMNDFRLISGFRYHVYNENRRFLAWLRQELREGDVVMTHHLPSPRSVPEEYKHSELNPYFVCNVEDLIRERKPKLWVHGHTHGRCEYQIGETWIVCNPHGYPMERQPYWFREDAVAEI
jgi:Icc-related predicted phosphoesterase